MLRMRISSYRSSCEIFTFCDVLHDAKQKKNKQTLQSAQYGLEISFENVSTWRAGEKHASIC